MPKRSTTNRKDGAETYLRILTAAGKLFAEQGFASTTNKAVAQHAQVDLASINYHFGNRRGLIQATLKAAHSHFIDIEELRAIALSGQHAEQQFEQLINMLVEKIMSGEGWQAQLLSRELLSPSDNIHALLNEESLPKFEIIRKIISGVVGIEHDNPSLLPCVVSVMAPCLMMVVIDKNALNPVQQMWQLPEEDVKHYLYTYALAGLQAVRGSFFQSH